MAELIKMLEIKSNTNEFFEKSIGVKDLKMKRKNVIIIKKTDVPIIYKLYKGPDGKIKSIQWGGDFFTWISYGDIEETNWKKAVKAAFFYGYSVYWFSKLEHGMEFFNELFTTLDEWKKKDKYIKEYRIKELKRRNILDRELAGIKDKDKDKKDKDKKDKDKD